jgi:cytochrome bd-type quinol oxidase subunit 1
VFCTAAMTSITDYPIAVLFGSFVVFWIAAWVGNWFRGGNGIVNEHAHADFVFVLSGALTLLALMVGFSFSMAVTRYDQRKNYEEEEANAIGTEYVRADLMPAADATKVRGLIQIYLAQRILAYEDRNEPGLRQIDAETARLQTDMWSSIARSASEKPSPVSGLVAMGMNDVLNSQGYAQAAWRNRIPVAAWLLLVIISIFCNVLVGYGAYGRSPLLFLILPIALSISLFLIADIDCPYRGVIRVHPVNLESLAASLKSH